MHVQKIGHHHCGSIKDYEQLLGTYISHIILENLRRLIKLIKSADGFFLAGSTKGILITVLSALIFFYF